MYLNRCRFSQSTFFPTSFSWSFCRIQDLRSTSCNSQRRDSTATSPAVLSSGSVVPVHTGFRLLHSSVKVMILNKEFRNMVLTLRKLVTHLSSFGCYIFSQSGVILIFFCFYVYNRMSIVIKFL
jgi:hypothetical protein